MKVLMLVSLLLAGLPAQSQQSAGFSLEQQAFNNGGRPIDGTTAESSSFRLSLDAISAAMRPTALAGSFFTGAGGLMAPLAPPREVTGLRFDSAIAMAWNPDPRGTAYNVYRGISPGAAGCQASRVVGTAHTAGGSPGPADAWFYLVTSVNSLDEESTRGFASNGSQRPETDSCF